MKRKLLTTVLIATMVLSMTACGGNDSSNKDTKDNSSVAESNETSEQQEESQSEAGNDAQESSDFTYEYVENNFGYKINLLNYYNESEGYGWVSYEALNGELNRVRSEVIYITQYSGDVGDDEQKERIDMTQYQDSTDIFDLLIGNIDSEFFRGGLSYTLKDYEVEILETTEINGLEMTKFEGTITVDDEDYEEDEVFPVVAYGIKTSQTPVLVMCIDRTRDRSRHEVWVDKIDEMIATFQDAE